MRDRFLTATVCAVVALGPACGRETTPPAPAGATRTSPVTAAEPDMKPVVREFLRTLPADWHLVTAEQIAAARPFVVDVREADEYARGFIPGAVNIPLRQLASNLQALPGPRQDVAVVCEDGHRAAVGMAVLQMLGVSGAKSLMGGMRSWRAAQLPISTGPVSPPTVRSVPDVDPRLQAMFDYYLTHTLQKDWGAMSVPELVEDQNRKSSAEIEAQPETFDQGRSLLLYVDGRQEFTATKSPPGARTRLAKAVNIPLREMPDLLDSMPLQETVNWA